jgi:hypothetical protein
MRIIPESVYLEKYLEEFQHLNLNDETINVGDGPFAGLQDFKIGQKTLHLNQAKNISSSVLSYSDWYVTRKSERSIDIPSEITLFRQQVLDTFQQHKEMILSVSSKEELKNLYEYQFIVEGKPESQRPLPEWPRM